MTSTFFKYGLTSLAVFGFALGVYVVKSGGSPVKAAEPVAQPSRPTFRSYIAGAGIVEPSSEDIQIGTPVAGIIAEVVVQVGSKVTAGDELFKLDVRDLNAELQVREAALKLAQAKVPELEAELAQAESQLQLYKNVTDSRAITQDEMNRRRYANSAAAARLEEAKAQVESAGAQIAQTRTEIERRIVRAPVNGEVLQVKTHPGEFAQAGVMQTPLMIVGSTEQLNVRTDIDENDAWRFRPGAEAIVSVRGNPQLQTKAFFVRVEPYVVPKKSLTGETTERVDTRVLQALYGFPRGALWVYVGQQMDVFIEAPDFANSAARPYSTPHGVQQ